MWRQLILRSGRPIADRCAEAQHQVLPGEPRPDQQPVPRRYQHQLDVEQAKATLAAAQAELATAAAKSRAAGARRWPSCWARRPRAFPSLIIRWITTCPSFPPACLPTCSSAGPTWPRRAPGGRAKRRPGMAAQQPPDPERQALRRAVPFERLHHIGGTARLIPAARPDQGREEQPVKADGQLQQENHVVFFCKGGKAKLYHETADLKRKARRYFIRRSKKTSHFVK